MDQEKIEAMAREIYDYCKKYELWEETCIYFNGGAWATWHNWNGVKGKKIEDNLYEYEYADPKDHFDCVYEPHILSMSFESLLNDIINENFQCENLLNEFSNIFNKYGCYYEQGNSWNLTVCPN